MLTFKKKSLLLFLLVIPSILFAQTFGEQREKNLIKAFLKFDSSDVYEDSSAYIELTKGIEQTIRLDNIFRFKNFKRIADSLYVTFRLQKSEWNNFKIFTLSFNGFYWNYVLNKNNEIRLRHNNGPAYFVAIHNLDEHTFLLIKRMNDLSFACYTAVVYSYTYLDVKKEKAFDKRDELMVCSWTHIDASFPV